MPSTITRGYHTDTGPSLAIRLPGHLDRAQPSLPFLRCAQQLSDMRTPSVT
ncbi:hypothetical protein GGTG_14385 [Gaeumannomyces tritici R3-111a-1]|uniref:Uncharacterized protein n=1 Tax=Gaeumannomyces tritici (strain R3-111a-1) TaxID=644352 RepID=J3PLC2_GAET3|nr:hypothetical protein GGTG_14385 [Gaeumannomyces tritici R3-111a-1]EJT68036.1 hypothetical protein GGTG_14385 [Gaeumannomyces tritici R3-111a-1]